MFGRKKINFKKGSGTAIIGLYLILFCMAMGIMFIGIYQKNEFRHQMQTSADTVADGVAVYMASNGGTYEDAKNEMRRLETLTKKYTGVGYRTLELNKRELEENNVADVDATVYLRDVYTKYNYRIASNAATEYREPYVSDNAYIQRDVTSIYLCTDPNDPNAEQKIILASELGSWDLNNDGEITTSEMNDTLNSFDGMQYTYMKYGVEGEWEYLNAENLNQYYGAKGYVEWAVAVANDDSHGYSMTNRYLSPDVDCSSLVYYALINNGYSFPGLSGPFSTWNEEEALLKAGFKKIPFSRNAAQTGDILWVRGYSSGKYRHHTAICTRPGEEVAAHRDIDGKPGDSSGNEVSVGPITTSYMYIYRP